MAILSPFVSGIYSKILQKLIPLLEDEVPTLLEVKEDLEDLHNKLANMGNIIKQAELKVFTDSSVNQWLLQLQDAVYDADDIIDDCRIKARFLDQSATTPSTPTSARKSSTVCSCFSGHLSCLCSTKPRKRLAKMVKEVNEKLDKLAKEEEQFGLLGSAEEVPPWSQNEVGGHAPTEIVGKAFEKDLADIMEWVASEIHDSCKEGVMVIVGKAGVGKTTLARRVFHHPMIESGCIFKKRVWVSMPGKAHDERSVLLEVVREIAAGESREECWSSAEELVQVLRDAAAEKDILLVLDGLGDGDVWENWVKAVLDAAGDGSRVLVTTRSEVACGRVPASSHILKVQGLSEADGLLLLSMTALLSSDAGEECFQDLMEVGGRIVSRCECNPLAIVLIGKVLRSKPKEKTEWQKVLEHEIWSLVFVTSLGADPSQIDKGVMSAVLISYLQLPLPQKQSLMYYCSLFPEDHDFRDFPAGEYWAAEELLKVEDAEEILDALTARGLLGPKPSTVEGRGRQVHGLVHLLGNLLCKEENMNFLGARGDLCKASVRRVSFLHEECLAEAATAQHERLRTLVLVDSHGLREVPRSLLRKSRYLRVLSLRGTGVEILPDSIKNLVHLRLLDVSHTPIRSLPEHLGELRSLIVLLFVSCKYLHALPNSILKLWDLRAVDLSGTEIHQMPQMIRALRQLQVLACGVVEDRDERSPPWSTMEELFHLTNLADLSLRNLENLSAGAQARVAAIRDKTHLKRLLLHCDPPRGGREESVVEAVFEELRPPPCLRELRVAGFHGLHLPTWISSTSLPVVSRISLEDCRSCLQLPCLGRMGRLKELTVSNASNVSELGPGFFCSEGCSSDLLPFFPSLEFMSFQGMPSLTKLSCMEPEDDQGRPHPFAELKDLRFSGCPKLRSLWGCLSRATCLATLHLKDLGNLEAIPDLPALRSLFVTNCPAVSRVGMLEALREVHWADEVNHVLSPWLGLLKSSSVAQRAPSLRTVYVNTVGCRLLRRLCPWERGMDWPLVKDVPRVCAYCPGTSFFVELEASPVRMRGRLPRGRFDYRGSSLRSAAEGSGCTGHVLRELRRRIAEECGSQQEDRCPATAGGVRM